MKNYRFSRCSVRLLMMSWLAMAALATQAQFYTPLQLAPSAPVQNEFGETIAGYGLPEEERPLVQVLTVLEGMSITEPNPDGTPQFWHDVLFESSIGSGAIDSCPMEGAGRFNVNVAYPPSVDGKHVFIRAYSHPTIAESVYYADSDIKRLDKSSPEYPFEIGPVNILLQPDTIRDDGLTDAMREQLFGSASVDVFAEMEDGRTIWEHFVAGTDYTDPDSFLAITSIRPVRELVGGQPAVVGEILEWASQTGRIYTIQYTTNLILGEFENISNAMDLAATPPLNVFTNLDLPSGAPLYYRVQVEWPDMPVEAQGMSPP